MRNDSTYSLKTGGWQGISSMSDVKDRACVSTITAVGRRTALPSSFLQHTVFSRVRESLLKVLTKTPETGGQRFVLPSLKILYLYVSGTAQKKL